MGVVYFTSNASTGAGSLAEAIQNARPGDVVRPDETVFERGATIEIALAGTLNVDKNLTLDGGPFRVALNGGSVVRCAFVANGATVAFSGFDFIGGATSSSGGGIYVEASATLVLTRCRVAGCSAGSGGGGIYSRGAVALNDCVATGCIARSANGGGISATGALVLDGSTVVGNSTGASGADVRATATLAASNSILGDVSSGSATVPNYLGCVVDVASSSVGFVASPPGNLAVDNWNADAWQNWDLRLLDDASGAPSPYRDSGNVDAASKYDVQGNFRGRETNGVATCSPGAYETLQADLFWIGEPFPQTLIDLAPQNITVSDFTETATAGRATVLISWIIPENASYSAIHWEFKLDDDTSFTPIAALNGTLKKRTASVYVGRIYVVRICGEFADGRRTAWSYVEFTADASINDADGDGQTTGTMLPSALSVVEPSFSVSEGWATSRFATSFGDATPQAGQTVFVDESVRFVDVPSTSNGSTLDLVVGGGATVSTGSDETARLDLSLGLGATFGVSASATLYRFGADAKINWTSGDLSVAVDVASSSLTIPPGATLTIDEATVRLRSFTTLQASAIDGTGDLVFALGGTVTFDPATTVNGVLISDYDAATNDVRITFETSELVWESRVSGSNVEITDPLLADDRFVFRFDRYANGEFVDFYATDLRVSDDEAPAYETTSNWNGAASPTLVDASAEPGWNYYRVRLDEPVEKGGVLLNAYASPTRYVAVWVGNDEPTRTYYYRGGAKGSFIEPGDWTLTSDGLVPCVEKPTQAGATFCVVDA